MKSTLEKELKDLKLLERNQTTSKIAWPSHFERHSQQARFAAVSYARRAAQDSTPQWQRLRPAGYHRLQLRLGRRI